MVEERRQDAFINVGNGPTRKGGQLAPGAAVRVVCDGVAAPRLGMQRYHEGGGGRLEIEPALHRMQFLSSAIRTALLGLCHMWRPGMRNEQMLLGAPEATSHASGATGEKASSEAMPNLLGSSAATEENVQLVCEEGGARVLAREMLAATGEVLSLVLGGADFERHAPTGTADGRCVPRTRSMMAPRGDQGQRW